MTKALLSVTLTAAATLTLAGCAPALPEQADTASDLRGDSIAALTVTSSGKQTRDAAVLLVDHDGRASRVDVPDIGIHQVAADAEGLYFGDGTDEVALTSGGLRRTARGKAVQNAEAIHLLPGGDRVSIYADGAAHTVARAGSQGVDLSTVRNDLLATAVCGDQVYGVAEDVSLADDGFGYLLINVLADPKDQVAGRWSPGREVDPPVSATCENEMLSFVHATLVPGTEAVDQQQAVRWDLRRDTVTTRGITGSGSAFAGDLEPPDDAAVLAGFAEDGYWQLDVASARMQQLFTREEDGLIASTSAADVVYLIEHEDDTTTLRALDAKTGREIAAKPLGSLASDLWQNDLAPVALTVLAPASTWGADTDRPGSTGCQRRCFSAEAAALNPHIPWAPAPGGVAAEQR